MITVNEVPSIGNRLGQAIVGGMEEGRERRSTEQALASIFKDNALARTVAMMSPEMRRSVLPGLLEQQSAKNFFELINKGRRGGQQINMPNEYPAEQQSNVQLPEMQNFMQPQPSFWERMKLGQPQTSPVPQQELSKALFSQPQPERALQNENPRGFLEGYSPEELLGMQMIAPKVAQGALGAAASQAFASQQAEKAEQRAVARQAEKERFEAEQKAKAESFAEKKEAEKEQIAKRADIRKAEMKFDETLSKEREVNSKIANEAKAMLKIVEENKNKFGPLRGYTSLENLKKFERNDKLREFDRRQASLVTKLAAAQQGASRMTDMARKLIVEGKIDRTQPRGTIKEGLKAIIEESRRPEKEAQAKDRLKKKYGNQLPEDFRTQISDIIASEEDPLSYPQWYAENTVIEDDNGQRHILKNGQWAVL